MIGHLILYLITGALVGVTAGLLGLGGGVLIIPFLVWQLPQVGMPQALLMRAAVATSLALVVCASVVSGWRHHRYGNIQWHIVRKMLFGLIVGAFIGTALATCIPNVILQAFFGTFLWFVAWRVAIPRREREDRTLPQGIRLTLMSMLISSLCIMLGIAGGSLLVPYLTHCRVPLRQAIATSTICIFPGALIGVLILMFFSPVSVAMPNYSAGYVYLPAFLGLLLPCVALVPVGVWLAMRLDVALTRRIFGILLFFIGCDMIYEAVTALKPFWIGKL